MRLLYNLLFPLFFLLSAPFYFLKMWRRGGWRGGFWQRFGMHDRPFRARDTAGRPVIWMHAVSVGEANICVPLQRELAARLPDAEWVVSTTTTTGMAELRRKLPPDARTIYYPVDLPGAVARAWRAVRPTAVILLEAEIWPNFLWRAADRAVPVMLVNARLSDRSHRGYRRWGFFFGPILRELALVAAQSEEDRRRWIAAGCGSDRVHCTGNLKFDLAAALPETRLDARALLRVAGFPEKGLKIVAGSTHAGEEALLARIFLRLRGDFPGLGLILVPRHMERAGTVEAELRQVGLPCIRRSTLGAERVKAAAAECLLVDSTGELPDFYRVADVVFIGKSLLGRGGQNPIEPAALGKSVLAGPNMQNFRDVTRLLVEGRGLVQVADEAALETELRRQLKDREYREVRGESARRIVVQNSGSLHKTTEKCESLLAVGKNCENPRIAV